MQTNKIKLLSFLFASAVLMTSCDKDDETSMSPDQAEEALASVDAELANELAELSEAEGFIALQSLADLSGSGTPLPTGRAKDIRRHPARYAKQAISVLNHMITEPTRSARSMSDEPFIYNENLGKYEWNFNEGYFQKTGTLNIIEIHFPTEGSTTNNAVLRLTDYEEVETPEGDEYYSPTVIEATLDVNGVKQASLSAEVEYRGDGTDEPKYADLTYFINPYTFEMDLDDRTASATSFSQYLKKGDDVLIGWSLAATYNTQYPKAGGVPKTLTGIFQLSDVVFAVELNAPSDVNNPSDDINDYVKITITIGGKKAGQVVWVTEVGSDDPVPYVQYTDGSKQPLEDIFSSLEEAVEELEVLG